MGRWLSGAALAGLLACTGMIGTNGTVANKPTSLSPSSMRRLSQVQYQQTVFDLLGVTVSTQSLPEDVKDPFDDDANQQPVSPALISALEQLAQQAALAVLAQPMLRDKVVGCMPTGPDDAVCFRSFITNFGRRAYRHPLTAQEIDEFMALQWTAKQDNNFYTGVESVLRVILQDPQFVYRIEIGKAVDGAPGWARLTGFEMATRLSYFIWGSTPDDTLLSAAQAGELDGKEGVAKQATRMLADPKARARIERFHAMWLGYDKPQTTPLQQAMRKESDALVDRAVFERPWKELFTSKETFIDDTLAMQYGLPAPGKPSWVSYGTTGRAGILSTASFLSVAGKFADTSPTQRGKFIQDRLLCSPVPPPPPNVKADAPPPVEGNVVCKYDRYSMHRQGGCASCHDRLDGVGFGLEQYDQNGVFRTVEMGLPQCTIAGKGTLPGVGTFQGPGELGAMLANGPQLDACLVKQTFRFAMGHRETSDDDVLLNRVLDRFRGNQTKFSELVMGIVTDDSFFFRRED